MVLDLAIISAIDVVSSMGRIVNQENSGTAAVGAGVVEGFGYGEEEISVEVEPSVKVIV